ncbi:peptidylprolyl isomerase [Prosthecobacter vanneervenii]|uniref:Parvulin-like peptidyl-prolyl isomerase n=1 Tax=Prosthecobacter vanneervenii TaxID=48466 RepID=A0A7W7Y9I8_9BACT|nr:peptidylprolyl isomerase [Prosthecobacter vanneervenii]MBB5031917.1 parvulin-like peptidyl-prolyl isomerase [Prosthecobacter vanneervenii]
MSRIFQGLLGWWTILFLVVAGCYVAADLYYYHGPVDRWLRGGVVAEVAGQPISRRELADALREELWKQDAKWAFLNPEARQKLRLEVLDRLIDARLIRAFRLKDAPVSTAPSPAARQEADMMQRQFAEAEEAPRRMAAQHLTPKTLAAQIEESLRDEAWIAAQIQPEVAKITPQVVQAWYQGHREKLRIPQAWHAAHLFLAQATPGKPDREAEIRGLQQQMLAGKSTFAQLVAAHSEDERSKRLGGDLGWFTHERMPADFIAAVRSLRVGQVSAPVRTRVGWHLILLKEQRASCLPAFEEVREEITAMLTSQRRESAVKQLLAALSKRVQVVTHAEVVSATEPAR